MLVDYAGHNGAAEVEVAASRVRQHQLRSPHVAWAARLLPILSATSQVSRLVDCRHLHLVGATQVCSSHSSRGFFSLATVGSSVCMALVCSNDGCGIVGKCGVALRCGDSGWFGHVASGACPVCICIGFRPVFRN
ncbi:hypothetical protein VPH35_139299 [Triticum aestivum]